ncbi:MAG: winged helix-turn-helix domain-containing protein [Bacteroidales bacterium]|nr:winged helix-turn-helix domain-containing protein [Bacteroidales bacterium]
MTLHDAIVEILLLSGKPMTTQEIANKLNITKTYKKRDGSEISAFQIHGRTRNYPHLFDRDGNLVSLKGNFQITSAKSIDTKTNIDIDQKEEYLMDMSYYKSVAEINTIVPDKPGLYCIRIKNIDVLPEPFNSELIKRNHNIIYIGIASQSLHRRMLEQSLRAKGSSTFFRSLGAVLGYHPPINSLATKRNKRNYKYSSVDEEKIIYWINRNLIINWIQYDENLDEIEIYLLRKYKPILNITKNPQYLPELLKLRNECEKIANGISENITLHNAIEIVLKENKAPLSASKIAGEINSKQLYYRKDGKPIPSSQIHMRVNHYTKMFSILDNGKISLITE